MVKKIDVHPFPLFSFTAEDFQGFYIQVQNSTSLQTMEKLIATLQKAKEGITLFDLKKIS